jgi:hypothetical protein
MDKSPRIPELSAFAVCIMVLFYGVLVKGKQEKS